MLLCKALPSCIQRSREKNLLYERVVGRYRSLKVLNGCRQKIHRILQYSQDGTFESRYAISCRIECRIARHKNLQIFVLIIRAVVWLTR